MHSAEASEQNTTPALLVAAAENGRRQGSPNGFIPVNFKQVGPYSEFNVKDRPSK